MKTAFISIGFKSRSSKDDIINLINDILHSFRFNTIVFVDEYEFQPGQEQEMMKNAFKDILNCDLFVAEVSEKAIGVGIEIGFAKGMSKKIIYLRQASSKYSKTVGGVSDFQISYIDLNDLKRKLSNILKNEEKG